MPPPRGTLEGANTERLKWEVERLHKDNEELTERIEAIEANLRHRDEVERKRLTAGIMLLGSVILALLGVIWAYRLVIFASKP